MPTRTMNQIMQHPDEEDFDPHLFEPTHPMDEGGEEIDISEGHQFHNQDFFLDDGILQHNQGIHLIINL